MNEKKIACLICGSNRIHRSERENSDQLTLGAEFTYREIYYTCDSCHEESDVFGETDKNYMYARKEAEKILIKELINNLVSLGINMAFFERVMELPIRTLTRWKSGDFSSSSLALLRIIKTYPWIVKVADYHFDPIFAKEIMAKEVYLTKPIVINNDLISGGSNVLATVCKENDWSYV